ncbi:MAG: response regulator, partial [Planctomycetes bacterium]|nr:response regulator [Planctomycetota bacterium]
QGNTIDLSCRRKKSRFAMGMRVELATDPDNGSESIPALLHDVSGGGVGVWCRRQFSQGTALSISDGGDSNWISGTVRHSSAGTDGYLIGIEFDETVCVEGGSASDETASNTRKSKSNRHGNEGRSRFRCPLLVARIAKGSVTGLVIASAVYVGLRFLDFEIFANEIAVGFAGAVIIGIGMGLLGARRETRFLSGITSAVDAFRATGEFPSPPTRNHDALRSALLNLATHHQQRAICDHIEQQKHVDTEETKSGILSIVSSDVRRPLEAIQQHAQVLREEVDSLSRNARLDLIETIAQEIHRIAEHVEDLDELQRLDAESSHNAQESTESCNLTETIANVVELFEPLAGERSIDLRLDSKGELPNVIASTDNVARVLKKLLANAIEQTQAGGAVIVEAAESSCELRVCVSDSGPGIPRERWSEAFERRTHGGSQEADRNHGQMLGAYVARRIVEAHHGRIWLDSEIAKGTTVCFTLPTVDTPVDEPQITDGLSADSRILVCDSDPELAAMMAQALRARQYRVTLSHCGAQLLQLLDNEPFDVVVTDLQLPDMGSQELLSALHSRQEQGFRTIVHSYDEHARDGAKTDVVAWLRRPANRPRLCEAVELATRKRFAHGKTIFMLEHGSLETRRLRTALEQAGHVVMSGVSMKEIQRLLECYSCDFLVLPDGAIGGDWNKLAELSFGEASQTQAILLVDEVRRSERSFEEQFNARAVAYRPGSEETVLAVIEPETVAAMSCA